MRGIGLAGLGAALLLGLCGGLSDATVKQALERAREADTIGMGIHAGMLTRDQAAGLNSARSSARAALGALRTYAGSTIADLAGDAAGMISKLTGEMSGAAITPAARHAALMTARDWDVTNLDVLQSPRSGAEYV